jgi:hypothetical protein
MDMTRKLVLACIVLFAANLSAQHASNLYFIANDGTIDAQTKLPVPTRLYSLDSKLGHLALVRAFDSIQTPLLRIDIFPECGTAVLLNGVGNPQQISDLDLNSLSIHSTSVEDDTSYISSYLLEKTSRDSLSLVVRSSSMAMSLQKDRTIQLGRRESQCNTLSIMKWEAGWTMDAPNGRRLLLSEAEPSSAFGCGPIPDTLLVGVDPQHWYLAQTNSIIKIISSWSESLTDSNLVFLVCSKALGSWLRVTVPGTQTRPTLLNGWIFGQLADTDPHTDYSRHLGFAPIERNSAFVIIPSSKDVRLYELGPKSRVLWINDDSTMTYRVDDTLFQAKVGTDALNRHLLTVAHELRGVQWAFMGAK